MSERDKDAVAVNVETEIDEVEIQQLIHDELHLLFGKLYECQVCGLVWGRKKTGGRRHPKRDTRCPDCREEQNIYETSL